MAGSGQSTERKLILAIGLCFSFMLVEIAAGVYAGSLAILTDAAHMLSDLSSFCVSLFAIYISALPGTMEMTFGYHRAEILGALFSILIIWVLTLWLVVQAVHRLVNPQPVKPLVMIYTSIFGIATNIVLASLLTHSHSHHHHFDHSQNLNLPLLHSHSPITSHDSADADSTPQIADHDPASTDSITALRILDQTAHSHATRLRRKTTESLSSRHIHSHNTDNINITAATIHAIGDLLQNVAVLFAGIMICLKPQWTVADPICTLVFSVIVFLTTIGILKDATNVLMEGSPAGIHPGDIMQDLLALDDVTHVHDVHTWSLSLGKPALACHIVVSDHSKAQDVLDQATELVQKKYQILHTTIQVDYSHTNSACTTDAHHKCHTEAN